MEFIPASKQYLDALCQITDEAKAQLKGLGIDQWQKGYPCREVWERDIAVGCTWLAVENGTLLVMWYAPKAELPKIVDMM